MHPRTFKYKYLRLHTIRLKHWSRLLTLFVFYRNLALLKLLAQLKNQKWVENLEYKIFFNCNETIDSMEIFLNISDFSFSYWILTKSSHFSIITVLLCTLCFVQFWKLSIFVTRRKIRKKIILVFVVILLNTIELGMINEIIK